MYLGGKSYPEIALTVGVSAVQIGRIVRKHGAQRKLGEALRLSHARPETKAKLSKANRRPCPAQVRAALKSVVGAEHPLWKGGLTITAGGYLQFTNSPGNGHHAGRYLHQVIAEFKVGRPLRAGEHVHHRDEDKLNNHPDNIEVMKAEEHARLHAETNQFWQQRAN